MYGFCSGVNFATLFDGTYKVGDVVRLRSGGADLTVMTVNDDSDGQSVHAIWTNLDEGAEEFRDLPAACLVLINRE